MPKNLADNILQILLSDGPLNSKAIIANLYNKYRINIDSEEINSLLYGKLHNRLIRDKDENGYPVWRIKGDTFEAAKGLEVKFYNELINRGIITPKNSQLDYQIKNPRNGKTYFLDIAVFKNEKKFNIEIDGFEHIRADARLSIQNQIRRGEDNCEIEIDWMDHNNSFADFKSIDSSGIFKWLLTHRSWCIRYHEELLKPHDITRNIWLIENGWKIIRFWNFAVKDNLNHCLQDVRVWISE